MKTVNIEIRKRLQEVLKSFAIAFVFGICYAIILLCTEIRIPCLYYEITGLYCPGCGVTRMCIAILKQDFRAVFYSNMAIAILLPILIPLFGSYIIRYVKTGKRCSTVLQNILLWFSIGVLLIFGVLRNLQMFSFMAPK